MPKFKYINRARYYSPSLHRFLSLDPIEHASGDYNWYRYVGNDPVNRVDPSGLESMGFDPVFGAPTDIMQPLYDWWDSVFGPKPPSTFDKTMSGLKHGFKEYGKSFSLIKSKFAPKVPLIKDKFIPQGAKAVKNAHPAAQACMAVAGAITLAPAAEAGYGYAYTHPLETIGGIEVLDGAYGGTPPNSVSSSIGKLLNEMGILP